jgi:hypothetical protein
VLELWEMIFNDHFPVEAVAEARSQFVGFLRASRQLRELSVSEWMVYGLLRPFDSYYYTVPAGAIDEAADGKECEVELPKTSLFLCVLGLESCMSY